MRNRNLKTAVVLVKYVFSGKNLRINNVMINNNISSQGSKVTRVSIGTLYYKVIIMHNTQFNFFI